MFYQGERFIMKTKIIIDSTTDLMPEHKNYIEDSKHLWEEELKNIRYTGIGSVIGTHAGPGAIAVAFFRK